MWGGVGGAGAPPHEEANVGKKELQYLWYSHLFISNGRLVGDKKGTTKTTPPPPTLGGNNDHWVGPQRPLSMAWPGPGRQRRPHGAKERGPKEGDPIH